MSWYCVFTYPQKESWAAWHLRRQQFPVFFPTIIKQYARRGPRAVPLFSRYLFVAFDVHRDPWRVISSTYGVRRLFSADEQTPLSVPEQTIESLMAQVAEGAANAHSDPIHHGCAVRIINGALASRQGICQFNEKGRVGLLVMFMNREIEVVFERGDVALAA